MRVVSDTETTPIKKDNSTDRMWIFGGKDIDTGEVYRFEPFRGPTEIKKAIEWAKEVKLWVGHNYLAFDLKEIDRHIQKNLIDHRRVIDSLVVSRLINYDRSIPKGGDSPHSLKSWGIRLGCHKGDFSNFNEYSQEMVEYWEQDLETNFQLYKHFLKYIEDPDWKASLRIEHDVQYELSLQQQHGFHFNKTKAEGILAEVIKRKTELEAEIEQDYPPKLEYVNSLKYRKKKDGEEVAVVQNAKKKYPLTRVDGDDLLCFDYVPFNPGSATDRIEALWDAGWKPFEKTKTHQQFLRLKVGDPYGKTVGSMDQEFYDKKKEHFEYYGWVVNEDNLNTLPETAPAGAKKLAQWLTLEGRRSSLVEWIGQVQDDGRIHGSTIHIGAWTGRGAHKAPNTANISSVWPENKPARTAVEEIKKAYDTDMRSCWDTPEGSWLVGVDADGIQLRILADYLWRHFGQDGYAKTILSGKKENETDIHNVNKRALGLNHLTRDDAKTFSL